ncbi:procollagen-proline 4-dioxygenase [Aureococcus anophagefferens]|nr:procollagen-proline 4-dioxygenase [Aureococcus anophagefferens]
MTPAPVVGPGNGEVCALTGKPLEHLELPQNYLHAAEPAVDPKWVSQIWIRQRAYNGLASVRIAPI